MSEQDIDYVEDSGPGIPELPQLDPAAVQEQLPGAGLPALPGWEQATIEQFLMGTGEGVHFLIGQGERDWQMTKKDLERIAPALTRICNRWEPALKLSPVADPLLVIHGLALYVWRSLLERERAKRDAEDAEPELPIAGYAEGPAPAAEEPATVDFEAVDGDGHAPYFPESPRARNP